MAHTAHVADQWSSYILSLDKGAMSGTKAPTLNAMHKVKFPIKKDIQRTHRLYANRGRHRSGISWIYLLHSKYYVAEVWPKIINRKLGKRKFIVVS